MNHIMIDCYKGSEYRLDDIRTVNSVLSEIVDVLGLKAVMPPFLLPYYYAKDADDDGISAFTILKGGHITIHTFPRRACMFFDLLYDGYFDEDKLKSILVKYFGYSQRDERTVRTERRYLDSSIDADKIWDGSKGSGDFGPHIIARFEDVDVSFEQVFDMLDRLPGDINMYPISRPYVIKADGYISGVVLIAQSHISFHYCIEDKTLFSDLFSCSFYRSNYFIDYLEKVFGKAEYMTLIRGSKHDSIIDNRQKKISKLSSWKENI